MFAEATVQVVKNLLAVDPCASAEEKDWLLATLSGPESPVPAEAAALRLGVSKPTFFRRLQSGEWKLTRLRKNRKVVLYRADEVERLRRQLFGRVA